MSSIQFGGQFFKIPIKQPGQAGAPENYMEKAQLVKMVEEVNKAHDGFASVNFYQPSERIWIGSEGTEDMSAGIGKGRNHPTDLFANVYFADIEPGSALINDEIFKRKADGFDAGFYVPNRSFNA